LSSRNFSEGSIVLNITWVYKQALAGTIVHEDMAQFQIFIKPESINLDPFPFVRIRVFGFVLFGLCIKKEFGFVEF
jgi:hypothetical protein